MKEEYVALHPEQKFLMNTMLWEFQGKQGENMVKTIVRSQWTGTRGVLDAGLPDDWDEAYSIVSRNSYSCKEPSFDYTPAIVQRAWDWLLREFGEEAAHADLTIKFVVELYLDS